MRKQNLIIALALASVHANAQEFIHTYSGQMIPISKISRIVPSNQEHPKSISLILEKDKKITLFTQALKLTGLMDSLKCYRDNTYGFASEQDRIDSCTWTNDKLCIHTGADYSNVAYPSHRYFQHTLFIETDSVYGSQGITSIDALEKKAHQLYDAMYPDDASVSDKTDRRNALNRFVSYHILPLWGEYYKLTEMDNNLLANNFDRNRQDIMDYYETCMPHSIMKFSFPSGSQEGLYINRRGVQDRPDYYGVFEKGAQVIPGSQTECVNGLYHYIDDIISYGNTTQKTVLNERMRFDCTTLSPDFMTKNDNGQIARGMTSDMFQYGIGGQGAIAAANMDHCVGFKAGFVRNMSYTNDTHLHISNRNLDFWFYGGDEVSVKGAYDISIKLPPVPAGKYELRMFTCIGFESRGIIQFYIDGVAAGQPVDMRQDGDKTFGWKNDNLGDEEATRNIDKAIREAGWMKGPDSYSPGSKATSTSSTFRQFSNTVRKIIGTFVTDGTSDHYLRIQQMNEAGGDLDLDFIEIVPESVYDNKEKEEDRL